ncbi:hypothetical protein GCM10009616_01180 [Microlunatus lacustris]
MTGLTCIQGDRLSTRAQAVGEDPTTLRAKVGKAGSAGPTGSVASAQDFTGSLQAEGGVGLGAYLTSSSTNAPVVAGSSHLAGQRDGPRRSAGTGRVTGARRPGAGSPRAAR